jgi:hypothetical protein
MERPERGSSWFRPEENNRQAERTEEDRGKK